MIYYTDITIDEAIIGVIIDFEYYRENGDDTVIVDSINNGGMEISNLITPAELENIKLDCVEHYKNVAFRYLEQSIFNNF